MIFIILLFVLVIIISFLLAFLSMKDYKHTIDKKGDYTPFLIRNTQNLSAGVLDSLHQSAKISDSIISFERLFKDGQSALVVFGMRSILSQFPQLNLLELEEYSHVPKNDISIWEISIKKDPTITFTNIFVNLPKLSEPEHFWFQLVSKPTEGGLFNCQIRIAAFLINSLRRKEILETVTKEPFVKIPRPYTAEKMLKFYQDRSIGLDKFNLNLKGADIIKLISLT